MENKFYSDMRRIIENTFSSKFTSKDISQAKDRITGLYLKGLISEPEYSNLLTLLPVINNTSLFTERDQDCNTNEEPDEKASAFLTFTKTERFYSNDKPIETPVKGNNPFNITKKPTRSYKYDFKEDEQKEHVLESDLPGNSFMVDKPESLSKHDNNIGEDKIEPIQDQKSNDFFNVTCPEGYTPPKRSSF